MDKEEANYHTEQMPLDILMDEQKLKEFADMFLSHLIVLEDDKQKLQKDMDRMQLKINFIKEKFETINEYIKFLQYGGHNFAAEIIRDNHHVFINAQRKVYDHMWGYKICGKEIPVKLDGWHICIRKEGHKGKCSYNKRD